MELTPIQVKDEPEVTWPTDGNENTLYTLAFFGADLTFLLLYIDIGTV